MLDAKLIAPIQSIAYIAETPPDLYRKSREPREKFHRTGDFYPFKEHQIDAMAIIETIRAHPRWAPVGPHKNVMILAIAVSKTMKNEEKIALRQSIDIDSLHRNRVEFMRLVRTFLTPYVS